MTAAQRFAEVLRRGGITLESAKDIFAERDLRFRPECIDAWLEGSVIPGLNVRFMMLVRSNLPPDDRQYFAEIFAQRGPEESRPLTERLCAAVRSGRVAEVESSLSGGVVIDGWDAKRGCAIGYAVQGEYPEISELLFAYGASAMAFVDGSNSAWMKALLNGSAAQVRLCLSNGASVSMTDREGRGVLELAALNQRKDPEVLRAVFLASQAAPSALNTPLGLVAGAGNQALVSACLDLGALVNGSSQHGRTALMAAAAVGDADTTKILIESGAEIGLADGQGRSALHHGVLGNSALVIRQLLDAGADPNAGDSEGQSPIDLACGTPMEVALTARPGNRGGPSWFDPAGKPFRFSYSKAFGLGFDPSNLDRPILYGGDYNGMMPAVAQYFVSDPAVRTDLGRFGLTWFMAYAEKLARKEDFVLEDLLATAEANGWVPTTGC